MGHGEYYDKNRPIRMSDPLRTFDPCWVCNTIGAKFALQYINSYRRRR